METFSYQNRIIGAVESRIGGRKENQDSYGMAETIHGLLVVVCDGMGGGPAGKTASTLATKAIIDHVSRANVGEDPANMMRKAGRAANEAVMGAVEKNPQLHGMGTTAVCVLLTDSKAYVMHVGDSRCYQLRKGSCVFRTKDHSYVGEMVRSGQMTEEEARNSNYSNIITRAIGIDAGLEIDVDTTDYQPGDRFALMSDGIWGALPEPQLIVLLSSSEAPAVIVEDMCERVERIGINKGGGHDNLTLALVEVNGVTPNTVPSKSVAGTVKGRGNSSSKTFTPKEFEGKQRGINPATEQGDRQIVIGRDQSVKRKLIAVWCLIGVLSLFCIWIIIALVADDSKEIEKEKEPSKEKVLEGQVDQSADETDKTAEMLNQLQKGKSANEESEGPEENDETVELGANTNVNEAQMTTPAASNQISAELQGAIALLQEQDAYNTDYKEKSRERVLHHKRGLYRQALQKVRNAARLETDEAKKAKLNELAKEMDNENIQNKVIAVPGNSNFSATKEALQKSHELAKKIQRLIK